MNAKYYTPASNRLLPLLLLSAISFLLLFAAAAPGARPLALTCPGNYTVQLDPGECGNHLFFDTLTWSSTVPLTDTVFFPASGSFFEIGTNLVTLAVTDNSGNLEVCDFEIEMQEFLPPVLDCATGNILDLLGECSREVSVEELLDAASIGCAGSFDVHRLDAGGSPVAPVITAFDVGSTLLFSVKHQTENLECIAQVQVGGGTPSAIECPSNRVIFCHEPTDTAFTGTPALTGCYQQVSLDFFDETTITSCPDSVGFQVVRSWVGTGPFGQQDTCQQLITAYRFDVSFVDFPPDYGPGAPEPALHCQDTLSPAELAAPESTGYPSFANLPVLTDPACKITVTHTDFVNNLCGGSAEIDRVWTVVQFCTPPVTVRDTQRLVVVDTAGPTFILPDTIFASLAPACADSLFLPGATQIQECGSYTAQILTAWDTLSTNGGWAPLPPSAGAHPVVYRLTDDCGNVSADTTVLWLNDETLVGCPPDLTVSCDFYFDTLFPALANFDTTFLQSLGMPEQHANCAFPVLENDSFLVDGCGVGSLHRTLTVQSPTPAVCVQVIQTEHVSDYGVIFPPDTAFCTSLNNVDPGTPTLLGNTCENLFVVPIDDIVPGEVNGCYTLHRTWRITNGCVYTGVNTNDDQQLGPLHWQDGGDGVVEHTQIIEVNGSLGPAFTNGCSIPDLFLFANDCQLTVNLPAPQVDACGGFDLQVTGDLGNEIGAQVELGPGLYGVAYTATDACGKVSSCNTFFEVMDTLAPELTCKADFIVVELMATTPALVQIWASDLLENYSDNCGIPDLSFYPDSLEQGYTFDCCDLGLNQLTVYATDEFGNQSSCQAGVIVQNNVGNCDGCLPTVTGTCYREDGAGIGQALVQLQEGGITVNQHLTGADGTFSLTHDYHLETSIAPVKDINPLNGVTTFDAVLIAKHILGVEALDSPYKLIAADINGSGSVTTFDMVQMRQLVLGITTSFPNNLSWRFVPAGYEFPNPQNPFFEDIPGAIDLPPLTEDLSGQDFIGIKIGDVNNSADPQQ